LFSGKGLVLGSDESGESTSPHTPLEEIVRLITYADHAKASAYAQLFIDDAHKDTRLH
jgi:hypothetical protein